MKYLVVTGGVVSGLGKGITISSLGVLLKAAGLRVTSIKIDPYLVSLPAVEAGNGFLVPSAVAGAGGGCFLAEQRIKALQPQAEDHVNPKFLLLLDATLQNSDAGTMSPFEHGEVFVLNDGGEVRGGRFFEGYSSFPGRVDCDLDERRTLSSRSLGTFPPYRRTLTLATTSAFWA